MGIKTLRDLFPWLAAALFAPVAMAAGPMTIEPGTDRMGSDYKGFALAADDPQLCRQACADDAACRAYTYVKPGLKGPKAMCFLKSAIPPATPDNCCTSGAAAPVAGARRDSRLRPVPAPAPQPAPSIAPPYDPKLDIDPDATSLRWSWHIVGCFPSGAGQPPVPCAKVTDIQGFRIYRTSGALVMTLADSARRSAYVGDAPDACYVVTAYKGSLESPKSAPVCISGDGSVGPAVIVPGPAPKPAAIVRQPISGITVRGEEAHANFNGACPLPEIHKWRRNAGGFNGAFPVGYERDNNATFADQFLSTGILCDALHTEWIEGSVKFDLSGLPADLSQAKLRFTSTGTCAITIHAYYVTLADNSSQADHSGDGWFSYLSQGVVSGQIQNAPGDTSTSELGVTALVKKALKAGKTSIGFAFYTDEALKNDAFSCQSTYGGFALEILPKS